MKNSISFCVFKIPQNQSIEKLTGNALEGFILFQTVMHSGPENLSDSPNNVTFFHPRKYLATNTQKHVMKIAWSVNNSKHH